MGKSTKNILFIIIGLVIIFVVVTLLQPKTLDWTPTYNTKDKIPLGLYVFDKEVDSFFSTYVERNKDPLKDYFYVVDGEPMDWYGYNLLYINEILRWDDGIIQDVCRFVHEGNSAFISASALPQTLKDSLGFSTQSILFDPIYAALLDQEITVVITDSCFADLKVSHPKGLTGSYFTTFDTIKTVELGHVKTVDYSATNFIKIYHGAGVFYIQLDPAVFTNYFLLTKDYHRYAEHALSHIPPNYDIIWSLNNQTSKVISESPFRFIKSQPPLYFAFILLIVGILMFVIFNIRRTQRIIKIIPKPVNSTVDFARTIGNLYFQKGSIRDIMDKKIIYLLERIRSEYHLSTEKLDDHFVQALHVRTGVDIKMIEKMVFLVNKHLLTDYTCTENDLKWLNESIENVLK
jgi:hypothetical protein